MKPALRLDVYVCHFAYGGNGGISSEHPDIREWEIETAFKFRDDPRVGAFHFKTISTTPITKARNKAIRLAKEKGCHLLLMVDSDQSPNKHKGEKWFKPFWDEAFKFIYDNYGKGPHVVGSPYCGPPNGKENVYVFQWDTDGNKDAETAYSLEQYTRAQASMMSGIQECAALPTGMILLDLRAADLVEPVPHSKREILEKVQADKMSVNDALAALKEGYFYYEYTNQYCEELASTEDVAFTRDVALAGMAKLGYNPVYCAWDSWVGHWKPWNVGKPRHYSTEHISASFAKAVREDRRDNELILDLSRLNQGDDPLSRRLREMQKAVDDAFSPQSNGNGHHKRNGDDKPLEMFGTDEEETQTPNIDTGKWTDHGHAPVYHQKALQDLVRSTAYKKYAEVRILEVGSWLGSTAIAMADAAKSKVHCVDTWEGTPTDVTKVLVEEAGGGDKVYEQFIKNIGERLNKTIFPWRGSSEEQSKKHWDPFDIIFIDADHTYEAVKADIRNWWPHLADDGVMVGHDFQVHGYDGLVKAVEESFGEEVDTLGWHTQGSLWMARKRDYPNGLEVKHEAHAT